MADSRGMKLLRTSLMALAALIVAGTVASAAPSFDEVVDPEPTVSPSPTVEPTVSPSPEAEPMVEADEDETDAVVEDEAPDFTECKEAEYTGLDNAICRHGVLVALHPDNTGLQNALERLEANRDRHEAKWAERHGDDPGDVTEGDASTCPGNSCGTHGGGNGHGHGPH